MLLFKCQAVLLLLAVAGYTILADSQPDHGNAGASLAVLKNRNQQRQRGHYSRPVTVSRPPPQQFHHHYVQPAPVRHAPPPPPPPPPTCEWVCTQSNIYG